jgi:hypothetical protein
VRDIAQYHMAHAAAQMEGSSGIMQVSKEIFAKLLRGNKINIAAESYADRGVRIFVEGTVDRI